MVLVNIVSLLLLFAVVGAITYWGIHAFLNRGLEKRLDVVRLGSAAAIGQSGGTQLSQWIQPILTRFIRFSIPTEENQLSAIKIKLLNAGYRGENPVILYYGIKTVFALLVPLAYLIYAMLYIDQSSIARTAMQITALCAFGYYLPNLILNYKIAQRKRLLFESFPDALDLIRICVASGLGIEAAVARVGSELHIISKELSEEFDILAMELRAGATRNDAFANLAMRCDIDDIKALVAMLMQASRFGTSVSESLHVYSDGLRTKRKLLAQEAAAKIPVKLALPLILCIFPAIFVVILGPAVINLMRVSNPLL
jgi:tight adherence protein C